MSHGALSVYATYRETTKRFLLIVGLWPKEQPRFLYRLLPWTQIFLSLGMVLTLTGYVREHFNNVALVTKGMSVMTSFLTVTLKVRINILITVNISNKSYRYAINFKVTLMIVNHKDLGELHQMLDPYFNDMLSKPKLSRIILNGVDTFRRLSLTLMIVTLFTCFVYVITPLAFIIIQHLRHVHPIKYILVFPGVYPWKISPNGLLYKIHYIFESSANMTLICATAGVDSLFILYVFQMIGQLRELSYRMSYTDWSSDNEDVLRKCMIQYTILMRCRDILQKIYGPIILWMMGTNAIILCAVIFQLAEVRIFLSNQV